MMSVGNARRYPYVVAIIQARLGSKRFPNKMLADLAGHPVLYHVINRVAMANSVHQVVVATPDDELFELAYATGAWGFKDAGDPNNVLARYVKCANWCDAEIVVRITGDCPLIDPKIIDICVNGFVENHVDISTNVLKRTYIRGFDVEVLHKNTLKRIYHLTNDTRYREHVTLFAHENPGLFVWNSVLHNGDNSQINLSIDTMEDLDIVRSYVSHESRADFDYESVLRWVHGRKLDSGGNEEQGGTSP